MQLTADPPSDRRMGIHEDARTTGICSGDCAVVMRAVYDDGQRRYHAGGNGLRRGFCWETPGIEAVVSDGSREDPTETKVKDLQPLLVGARSAPSLYPQKQHPRASSDRKFPKQTVARKTDGREKTGQKRRGNSSRMSLPVRMHLSTGHHRRTNRRLLERTRARWCVP